MATSLLGGSLKKTTRLLILNVTIVWLEVTTNYQVTFATSNYVSSKYKHKGS